jgi:putative RNA 2'-phosphotransferase
MKRVYIKISKFLSYLLRHHPEKFNLSLDPEGFAELGEVLIILNKRFDNLQQDITKSTLIDLIRTSDKKRFEIKENKIRAYYGHSLSKRINMKEAINLPPKLYHGTTFKAYNKIEVEGLNKKRRQYVHLSDNIASAMMVGKRRTKNPIIIEIDVKSAQKDGVGFYKSGDMFLADYIPPKYFSRVDD